MINSESKKLQLEPGFAWELQTFGATCFPSFRAESSSDITDIVLDYFGTANGDVIASADQSWLNELLQGCKADVYVTTAPVELMYDEERAKSVATSRFKSYHKPTCCIRS